MTFEITRFARNSVTGKREQTECYRVSDAGDIRYTDSDCIADFQRGQNDYLVEQSLFAPDMQLTIRTRAGSIRVKRLD